GAGNFGGRPGQGDETKNPGGSNSKDAKQLGESLAFLRQKMEMEKQMDLKWKKKEWSEFGRRKMLEESAIKMGFDMFGKFAEKAVLDPFANMIGNAVAGGKGTRGFQCAAGDFKFISMAKFGQLECSHVSGTVACKNGLKATGCQDVTLNGSAPDDPAEGGGTIHPPGQVPAAGARNNRQYQSHLGQTSGNLQRGRQELSARMRLMESACANSPGMSASLKKKTCDLSEAAKTIETGYGHLKAASDSLQTAFQKVELAADAMNNETSGEGKLLLGAGQKLNTAAEKLEEAYKALNFSEEKEPNIESAKEAVAKAAEAFEVALKNHEAAQKAIGTVNKALKEAQEAAEAAAASLKEGQDVLTKTIIPGEIADGDNAQGTTTQYPEWRTIVINNKDEALNKTSVDIDVRHQNWVAMNKEAVAARDALHGKANSDQLKPVEGGTPVEGMGAVGTTYNNMLQYTQPLTEKEGGPLISAHKPAWDAYKAAATRDGCDAACAKGIYKQSFDGAIKGVRGTMVSDNSENAAESVRVTANARNLALIIGKNLPAGDAAVARAP
ncbi:MAG: hypothetical protein HY928_11140, partial [Elusimicrobia bacterium]|nr:hypothetical protein [Elusimicrobiota bacterium]